MEFFAPLLCTLLNRLNLLQTPPLRLLLFTHFQNISDMLVLVSLADS